MVYIKSDTVRVGNTVYKITIRYLARRKRFVTALPDVMAEALGYKEIQAETLDQLESLWFPTYKEYEKIVSAEEKVIVYDYKCNAIVWNEDKSRVVFREESIFMHGTGLSLKWYIGFRIERPEEVPSFYGERKDGSRYYVEREDKKTRYMAWTPDRERFFRAMEAGLHDMIMKAHAFFTTSEDIGLIIDAGATPLLNAPEEKH